MGSYKKILSVVISCAVALSSAAAMLPVSSAAVQTDTSAVIYDSTSNAESKEASLSEVPFNVFDIYNAYHGIPKTTTSTTTTPTDTSRTDSSQTP